MQLPRMLVCLSRRLLLLVLLLLLLVLLLLLLVLLVLLLQLLLLSTMNGCTMDSCFKAPRAAEGDVLACTCRWQNSKAPVGVAWSTALRICHGLMGGTTGEI
jgi:hypothetical protein